MSYVIKIERRQGEPLLLDEMVRAIAADGDFEPIERNGTLGAWSWRGAPDGSEMAVNIEADLLWTDGGRAWTTEVAIARLQRLARKLNADLTGEEGEDLNHVTTPVHSQPVKPQGPVGTILSLLLLAPVLLVSAIAWAGASLMKLLRRK